MTIALIGTEDATRTAARVGLITAQDVGLEADLERDGFEVVRCSSWGEFEQRQAEGTFDLVFCDDADRGAMPTDCSAPVVRIHDDSELSRDVLGLLVRLGVELANRGSRLAELEGLVEGIRNGDALVGNTPAMRRVRGAISRAADCDATVLIEGPKGSGKSLAARAIHLKSRRSGHAIVVHECATLSADELTKELASCTSTTLVLEDVDELPAATQAVLVRHLKERSTSTAPQLARLIATTSAHIPELVARGSFREDLYYRLHAFPVMVPGLHERVDDIALLAESILDAGVPASGRNHRGLSPAALVLLESMQWPGNVAQLEATVRRGQLLAGGGAIDREHLIAPSTSVAPNSAPGSTTGNREAEEVELTEDAIRPFEEEEKFLLGRALQATKGNVRRAAQLLGIGRATLYRKIQQYDLRLH